MVPWREEGGVDAVRLQQRGTTRSASARASWSPRCVRRGDAVEGAREVTDAQEDAHRRGAARRCFRWRARSCDGAHQEGSARGVVVSKAVPAPAPARWSHLRVSPRGGRRSCSRVFHLARHVDVACVAREGANGAHLAMREGVVDHDDGSHADHAMGQHHRHRHRHRRAPRGRHHTGHQVTIAALPASCCRLHHRTCDDVIVDAMVTGEVVATSTFSWKRQSGEREREARARWERKAVVVAAASMRARWEVVVATSVAEVAQVATSGTTAVSRGRATARSRWHHWMRRVGKWWST